MLPLRDNAPTRTTPYVTIGLIVANAIVWFWELSSPGVNQHVARDGYSPCAVSPPCHVGPHLPWYEGAFSSMFMHASWEHILGNMLFLWIFGNNVEDALGHLRFLFWYVAAGLAATAAQTAITLGFGTEQDKLIPNIGASGAIAGVLGAYFLLLPRARVLTVIFLGIVFFREIPAIWFLGIWIALQAWSGGLSILHPQQGGGTAFFAHIGGFVFGLATVYLVARHRRPEPRSAAFWWRPSSASSGHSPRCRRSSHVASRTWRSSSKTRIRRIPTCSGCSRSSPTSPPRSRSTGSRSSSRSPTRTSWSGRSASPSCTRSRTTSGSTRRDWTSSATGSATWNSRRGRAF